MPRKHRDAADDISLRIPMIFCSNFPLPDDDEYRGLRERFLIVQIPKEAPTYVNNDGADPYAQFFPSSTAAAQQDSDSES